MTAEEGLEILEQKQAIAEAGMTRLQNQMSVKQARKFRRLVRERAKLWRTMQERVFTKSLREKGGRVSKKAKGIGFDGRSRYVLVDGAPSIRLNNHSVILALVHRYPDGNIILDLRLWGVKHDEKWNSHFTPTRKGITMPMAKVYQLIGNLQALYGTWKRKHPDQVEEPPEPSREDRRKMAKLWRFLEANRS
jgi:hypothetical protein